MVIAEPPTLSVVYLANGGTGTVIDSALYGAGQLVTAMPNGFTRTGYTFSGWNTAPDGIDGTAYPAGVPFTISSSLTLYARWTINLYTLSFDSQGGSPVSSVSVPYGMINNLPTPPTLTGSTFAGWWTLPAGNGSPFLATTAVTTDLTVYAKWLPVNYTVSFDSQGGTSVSAVSANHGTTITPPLPTRTGYTFAGWWTGTGGSGSQLTSTTKIIANLFVFAHWVKNEYTVTFDSQGGTAVASVTASFNSTINPPTPTRTGYTFGGWRTEPNWGGEVFQGWTPITGNTTLFAQWSLNYYTVIFDGQGTNDYGDTVAHGSTPNIFPQPARYGYTFAGWRTGINGGGLPFTPTTVITAPITVYAQWTPLTYSVTFDSQGGSAVAGITVAHGSTITLPTPPTRTGYTFAGWRTEMYGAGVAVTSSTTVTFDRICYASWTANIYTLTFDSQGGTAVPSQNGLFGSQVALPVPTKTGYSFGGWRTEPNGAGSPFSSGSTIPGNLTIYAQWYANTYTITFNINGGSGSVPSGKSAPYNTTISLPAPSDSWGNSEGVFDGWWTSSDGTGTQFSADTPVTGNLTLYARWIQLAQWIKSTTAQTNASYLDVASDQAGNTYSVGYLDAASSVSFGGVSVTPQSGVRSVLIVKYNSSGVAQWARSVDSSTGDTVFRGVDIDSVGNSYAVGYSKDSGEVVLGNGVSVTGATALLVKYNGAGVAQWVRNVTGGAPTSSADTFQGVCVDGAGNLYAVGSLSGTGIADFGNGVTTARPTNFLVKYNSSGTAQWVQNPGVTLVGVTTDGNGNVGVAGSLWGTGSVSFGNSVSASGSASTNNAVIIKYSAQGQAQWAQTPNLQSPSTVFNQVVGDGAGNFYLTGYVEGTGTAGFGNGVTSRGAATGANLVVVKYNSTGSAQWATQLTSSSTNSAGLGIAMRGGNLFVAGLTHGYYSTVNFGNGARISTSTGVEPFIVKYNTDGVPLWAQSLLSGANTANNAANAVAVDGFGDAYMVGVIWGVGSYNFGNEVSTTNGPYVLKYDGH